MAGQVVVQVLGPIGIVIDGRPIDLGGNRQRWSLAALAVDAGVVVSADVLVERLWGDGALPADPRAALRTTMTRLRQAASGNGLVATEPGGWRLESAGA